MAAYALQRPASASPDAVSVELFECGTHESSQQQQQQQHPPGSPPAPGAAAMVPQAWLCSLSADWSHVLPAGVPAPMEEEFVVDLGALHPLVVSATAVLWAESKQIS